eukprot:13935-Heterococcus_DN1.PRE.2
MASSSLFVHCCVALFARCCFQRLRQVDREDAISNGIRKQPHSKMQNTRRFEAAVEQNQMFIVRVVDAAAVCTPFWILRISEVQSELLAAHSHLLRHMQCKTAQPSLLLTLVYCVTSSIELLRRN